MRRLISVALLIAVTSSGMVIADLVDDFESYPTGEVNTVTGGKWWSSTPSWGLIETRAVRPETSADNKQLVAINAVNLRGKLGDRAIESGQVTFFAHFRASNNQTNHSFGLTDLDDANDWGHFVVQVALVNGNIQVRDGGTTRTLASIASGWSAAMYNLWVVIDYDAQTFKVYMNREPEWDPSVVNEADRLKAGEIDTFGFRRIPAGPLDTFYVKGNSDQRIWLDNIYISGDPTRANTPFPANGATMVGEPDGAHAWVEFNWKPGEDPDNPGQPYPLIRKYYLYLSKDRAIYPNDPNLYFEAEIDAGDPINPVASSGPMQLNLDGSYRWAVDTAIELPNGSISAADDPNTIAGPVWTFQTKKSLPVITVQPQDALFDSVINEPTEVFSVEAVSGSIVQYAWYRTQDFANNTFDDDVQINWVDKLVLNSVGLADEGYYYCKIWNSPENAVYSNPVRLGIKRQKAHWTLDALVNNQYADALGAYPADPNNPAAVQFVADAIHESGITIDGSSFALASGQLDPSAYTNQITISAWIRITGDLADTDGCGIVSKRNDGSGDQWRWSLYARGRGGQNMRSIRMQTWNGGDAWTNANSVPGNEWVHVCATVDGSRIGRIYINGMVNGNTYSNWNWGPHAAAPVVIGRWTPANSLFPGDIDDIQIWNYAKTPREVISLYHGGTGKSVCYDPYATAFDFNNDCVVNLLDFAEFAKSWLSCGRYPDCD